MLPPRRGTGPEEEKVGREAGVKGLLLVFCRALCLLPSSPKIFGAQHHSEASFVAPSAALNLKVRLSAATPTTPSTDSTRSS